MDQPLCANPNCQKPFTPKRGDQRFCHKKCKDHYFHLKRHTQNTNQRSKKACETPGCSKTAILTERQARYRRETFGMVVCNSCKQKLQSDLQKRKSIEEYPITDPYLEGLFVPGNVPSNSILVCPLG